MLLYACGALSGGKSGAPRSSLGTPLKMLHPQTWGYNLLDQECCLTIDARELQQSTRYR